MKPTAKLSQNAITRAALKVVLPVGLILLVLVTGLSAWSISQFIQTMRVERQSLDLQAKLNDVYVLIQGAEASQRGYLLTGNDDYLKTYLESVPQIPQEIKILAKLAANTPNQLERVERLKSLMQRRLEDLKITVLLTQNMQSAKALAVVNTDEGERLMRDIRDVVDQMDTTSKKDLKVHEAFFQKYSSILLRTIVIGSVLAGALVALFAYLSRLEIRRRAQTEKDLQGAQEAALVASKLKSQFLATVSHEIRTPLNGIIGMSEVLSTREKDLEKKRFVEVIHNSGQALLKIVNDILDFSKVEAGKIDFELAEFSVSHLIDDTSELLAIKAREKNLELLTYVEPGVPTQLIGDASRVAQVLRNLLNNALKFTDSGGILVRAQVRFQAGAKVVVRFDVEDTGIGIPEDQIPLLFVPFSQLRLPAEKRQEGTGLGLSICKALVEQMGGRIGIESRGENAGSDFWFEVPFRVHDERNLEHAKASKEISSWQGSQFASFGCDALLTEVIEAYAVESSSTLVNHAHEMREAELQKLAKFAGKSFVFLPLGADADSSVRLQNAQNAQPEQLSQMVETNSNLTFIFVTRNSFDQIDERLLQNANTRLLRAPFTRDEFLASLSGSLINQVHEVRLEDGNHAGGSAAAHALILLVEDNPTNQLIAQAQLEPLGYRVHCVGNGEEAVEAVSRLRYDLILMDCQMPVMNGYEATRRIRSREASTGTIRVPIVALTANASADDREKCLASGMDDYIAKPFKARDLDAAIRKWVKNVSGDFGRGPIDWTALRELETKTSAAVVIRLIESFLKTLPHSLSEIETALNAHDTDRMRSWAHQLKASSASLGARELARLCDELESMVEKGTSIASIEEKARELIFIGKEVFDRFSNQKQYPSS